MSSQTPTIETTTSPASEPPAPTPAPDPSADEVVGRFLSDLRRRDLDALALLLRDHPAADAPAGDMASRDEAARDCAQVVLRSFSGSGLVETERHASTDGQTVFVEFRRHHPDAAGWTERRTGIRLLRFTTRGSSITGITEYAHPFAVESPGTDATAPGGAARAGSDRAAAGRGGRVSDGLAWPSLDAVRPADPRSGGR